MRVDALGATRDGALGETSRAGEPIRLNRNENAYGPSGNVVATFS